MSQNGKFQLRNSYLRSLLFSLSASVLSKMVGSISSFFIAKNLQPANYGIWITMLLFVSYSSILSLGTIEALLKRFPFYKGKGDINSANRLEHVVFTGTVITVAVAFVVVLFLPIFLKQLPTKSIMPAIIVIAVAGSLSFPSAFFYYRFLAHQDFKTVGFLESLRALLNIIIVVGLSYIWGLTGAAVGYCMTEMILCSVSGVLSIHNHGRVKPIYDLSAIWNSIIIGFPITIYVWVSMLQGSVDRLVSISLLGKVAAGYYGFGISIVSVMFLLPASISRVLYPRVSQKYGETSREEDLYKIIIFPAHSLCLIMGGVIGVAVIFMPLVYHMIPKYHPGLAAGQILLALSVLQLSTVTGVNYLIATNRQNQLLLLAFASLCVGAIAAYGAVRLGYGIEGLAFSTCCSRLLFALYVWRMVFASMGYALSKQMKEIIIMYIPFLLLLLLLGCGIYVIPHLLVQTTILAVAYALIFALIYSGILYALPLTRRWAIDVSIVLRRAFVLEK